MKPPSAQEASHESYRFIYVACLVAVVEMSRKIKPKVICVAALGGFVTLLSPAMVSHLE